MKNKKFFLIMTAFTVTVLGFFIFSYLFLGVFSRFKAAENVSFSTTLYAGMHEGDYNKTGKEVVETRNILLSFALPCEPVLVYFSNIETVGKPYLKSAGGCITDGEIPRHVQDALKAKNKLPYKFSLTKAYKFTIYGQTAIVLRKVWPEIFKLSENGAKLEFPLIQVVHADGVSDFYIERK